MRPRTGIRTWLRASLLVGGLALLGYVVSGFQVSNHLENPYLAEPWWYALPVAFVSLGVLAGISLLASGIATLVSPGQAVADVDPPSDPCFRDPNPGGWGPQI